MQCPLNIFTFLHKPNWIQDVLKNIHEWRWTFIVRCRDDRPARSPTNMAIYLQDNLYISQLTLARQNIAEPALAVTN